jgi:hypothetical protein
MRDHEECANGKTKCDDPTPFGGTNTSRQRRSCEQNSSFQADARGIGKAHKREEMRAIASEKVKSNSPARNEETLASQ